MDQRILRTIEGETVIVSDGDVFSNVRFITCHVVVSEEVKVTFNICDFDRCTFEIDGEHYNSDGFVRWLESRKPGSTKPIVLQ